MNIKKFNIKGNEQYKILLQSVISKDIVTNSDYKSFDDLVRNRNYTEELACTKNIELKDFDNRYELGKYLNDALSDCKHSEIENNENMWNWISCFYMRKILSAKGGRDIARFQFTRAREGRRNLIRTPWMLYNINGENSKFALPSALHIHSNECETYSSRPELYRNAIVGKLCMELYWDKKNNKVFANATDHRKQGRAGVLYPRLYKKILELSKLYDLWSVDMETLRELVGDEFDSIKKEAANKQETKSKNPVWKRNEQIVVLKHYFESDDPIKLSKNKEKIKEISLLLKSLDENKKIETQSNFRSEEGVRRKILNFCSIDPRVDDDDGLDHYSKGDEKIFMEFYNNDKKKNEIETIYDVIIKK
tara:strand:+ start:1576 stop:2667 length:1092 start_codon:yes stop_codon:yes gene_type:complete